MLVYYQTVESLNMLTRISNILVNNVGNYISNYYPTRLVNPLLKFQALEQFVEWFCFIVCSTSTHIYFIQYAWVDLTSCIFCISYM